MSDIEAKPSICMETSSDGIITIDLFGTQFKFKPEGKVDRPELIVDEMNQYVQNAEKQIPFTASDRNKLAILLLACMNMSNDLREMRVQHDTINNHVIKRATSLIEKIEPHISEYIKAPV